MSGVVVVVTAVVVVVVKVVVVTAVADVTDVVDVDVFVEENTGEMVSVKLSSVVPTLVESDVVMSFSPVVVKSISVCCALSCIVVITAFVVVTPATTRNIKMPLMRIIPFFVFPETS